jgi:hypothetical protein
MQAKLAHAQQARDLAALTTLTAEATLLLGPFAGSPEVKPEYATSPDSGAPEMARLERALIDQAAGMRGRNGWDLAAAAGKSSRVQPRLRVSFRQAVSYLRSWEGAAGDPASFRSLAMDGFDYILRQQASTGAFGYPYDPESRGGLTLEALKLVRQGESRGMRMTEGRWVIEDLDNGGLQFDHGEAGAGLLHLYAATGEAKYLNAARKAADWAAGRPLVVNWNYNSFSGWLLARMYRISGEKKYLDAAVDKFQFGVLPGQMANGRWFDPHNARPQYHALMCRNLVEYVLALEMSGHPAAAETRRKTFLALDSMAEETIRFGASNLEEGLPLEALTVGLLAFGDRPGWARAAHLYAHALLGAGRLPDTLSNYLLYRKLVNSKAQACEATLKCRPH